MRTAAEIVDLLNGYEGDNVWEDVVKRMPEYDADATAELDPSFASDRIALQGGAVLRHTREDGWFELAQ